MGMDAFGMDEMDGFPQAEIPQNEEEIPDYGLAELFGEDVEDKLKLKRPRELKYLLKKEDVNKEDTPAQSEATLLDNLTDLLVAE